MSDDRLEQIKARRYDWWNQGAPHPDDARVASEEATVDRDYLVERLERVEAERDRHGAGGTMIDRLAELCDRVAELEAENARLAQELKSAHPAQNTDRELWREAPDYYAPSVFVTQGGAIGMNVGGFVRVMSVRDWHGLQAENARLVEENAAYARSFDSWKRITEERGEQRDALEAEITRLVQELKSAHEVLVDCGDQSQALAGRVERLEAALRDLVVNYYDYVSQTQGSVEAIQRARAALGEP